MTGGGRAPRGRRSVEDEAAFRRAVDQAKARYNLSDVAGRYTKLTKAGPRAMRGLCPFHQERSPSFHVYDADGGFYCFAGETRVITWSGIYPIEQLAGGWHRLLTAGGKWVYAPVRSFGKQRLYNVKLSRNGVKKTIRATAEHRWIVHRRRGWVTTAELRFGHRLASVFPAQRPLNLDDEGIRHGIVFGDGTREKRGAQVDLHGDKADDLLRYFDGYPTWQGQRSGGGRYTKVRGLCPTMKELPPTDASADYIAGFLAGYLATDGCVSADGTVALHCADATVLEAVRAMSLRLGIGTHGVTSQMRIGYGTEASAIHRIHFASDQLPANLIIRPEAARRFTESAKKYARHRWQVVSVEETEATEEVFCAQVRGTHSFALEDNILTGNCFGCGAGGDIVSFLMRKLGIRMLEAVRWLDGAALPVVTPEQRARMAEEDEADRAASIELARTVWRAARPAFGTPAEIYARMRGITTPLPASIRYAATPAWYDGETGECGPSIPAVIGCVQDADGAFMGIQRIFLSKGGQAKAKMPKLTLGRFKGGALRLGPIAPEIIVCEGPEDGWTLRQEIAGATVWAALGTANMASMILPDGVERVRLAGDNGDAGRKAVAAAAEAHTARGLEVTAFFPPDEFKDFNDQLRGIRA